MLEILMITSLFLSIGGRQLDFYMIEYNLVLPQVLVFWDSESNAKIKPLFHTKYIKCPFPECI